MPRLRPFLTVEWTWYYVNWTIPNGSVCPYQYYCQNTQHFFYEYPYYVAACARLVYSVGFHLVLWIFSLLIFLYPSSRCATLATICRNNAYRFLLAHETLVVVKMYRSNAKPLLNSPEHAYNRLLIYECLRGLDRQGETNLMLWADLLVSLSICFTKKMWKKFNFAKPSIPFEF